MNCCDVTNVDDVYRCTVLFPFCFLRYLYWLMPDKKCQRYSAKWKNSIDSKKHAGLIQESIFLCRLTSIFSVTDSNFFVSNWYKLYMHKLITLTLINFPVDWPKWVLCNNSSRGLFVADFYYPMVNLILERTKSSHTPKPWKLK